MVCDEFLAVLSLRKFESVLSSPKATTQVKGVSNDK